jgi:pimeloyl-ACP methyl ester carboxylesterase
MDNRKKHLLPRILAGVLALLLLFLAVIFCVHRIRRSKTRSALAAEGYRYAQTDSGYALSYLKTGNEQASHIVVALSGIGVHDYSVILQPMTDYLAADTLFVEIDRAGYGLSSDTRVPQNVEQIVSDYRSALKNAKIEPPYVLLPHSLGGVYAAYWESRYPDEIEGVFFLDAAVLSADGATYDIAPHFWDYVYSLGSRIGLQRLIRFYPAHDPQKYSALQLRSSDWLNNYGALTAAQISEKKLGNQNALAAWNSIVTNEIPKAYLSASDAIRTPAEFDELYAYYNEARARDGLPPEEFSAEQREEQLRLAAERTPNSLMPYLEKLGNCEYIPLPGAHMIVEQKPMECAVLLSQFLTRLDEQKGT